MMTHAICPEHLVVVHYHLRPGGVRRVLETTLPAVVAAMPSLKRVTIFVGEANDPHGVASLRAKLRGFPCELHIHPSAGYFSESARDVEAMHRELNAALTKIVHPGEETVLWAHNLGLARNLPLAQEVAAIASTPGVRLVSHHHDFWFENRWSRWPEFSDSGVKTLDAVADCIFARGARVAYATINRQDFEAVSQFANHPAAWLPNALNPHADHPHLQAREVQAARGWLQAQFGEDVPVWVVPARFLRRKNMVEAMWLMRCLCPEGWLISSAGPSSKDELAAYRNISDFAKAGNLRVRFGVLAGARDDVPSIDALIAACDGVMVSSIQEGFGLPYLEAAAAGRPLIARHLPNVFQDFESLGFHPANTYSEVWIHADLLDMEKEKIRQQSRWQNWLAHLPPAARALVGAPWISTWQPGTPVAFGRLTLDAQLELLSVPSDIAWKSCASLNPALCQISGRMQSNAMAPDEIPSALIARLSVEKYAESFWSLAQSAEVHCDLTPGAMQRSMLAGRLRSECLFPLLW